MKKSLKTIVAVACVAMALSIAGCEKDNTNQNGNDTVNDNQGQQASAEEKMIVGHWNEDEVLYITAGDTASMLEEGETSEITFNADKTYETIYHSVDGDSEGEGTWSASNNKITMTDEFGPQTFTIDQLDTNVFNITRNEAGVTFVIKMTR